MARVLKTLFVKLYGADQSNFWHYVRAFWQRWFTFMSGAPSVPAAILAVYVENTTAKIVLGITAVICFVLSGFLVWRIERQKVVDLERKLTPSITVGYDPRIPQCKATPLFKGGRRPLRGCPRFC
jgi:hypothetical protein